jgi:hypothetical protein
MEAILGAALIEQLAPLLGVEVDMVRRIVLDASCDDVVLAYVELAGSTKLLDVKWGEAGIQVQVVDEKEGV